MTAQHAQDRCVLCQAPSHGFLEVVPVCAQHGRYGLVEEHVTRLVAALRRWITAMDACQGAITQDMDVDAVVAAVDESQAATEALVALAREVGGWLSDQQMRSSPQRDSGA